MPRMEDNWVAANDNGFSWKRQLLWRKADKLMARWEKIPLSPVQEKQAQDYLQKLFGKLDKEEFPPHS